METQATKDSGTRNSIYGHIAQHFDRLNDPEGQFQILKKVISFKNKPLLVDGKSSEIINRMEEY